MRALGMGPVGGFGEALGGGDRCVLRVEVGNGAAVRLYELPGYRDAREREAHGHAWPDLTGETPKIRVSTEAGQLQVNSNAPSG